MEESDDVTAYDCQKDFVLLEKRHRQIYYTIDKPVEMPDGASRTNSE